MSTGARIEYLGRRCSFPRQITRAASDVRNANSISLRYPRDARRLDGSYLGRPRLGNRTAHACNIPSAYNVARISTAF